MTAAIDSTSDIHSEVAICNRVVQFESLDGLRAIACILVLIAHFSVSINFKSSFLEVLKEIFPAQIGIIIFFCLSSFLITNMLIKEYKEDKKINIIKFFIRRSLRIWPLYLFILLVTLVILAPTKLQPYSQMSVSSHQWSWIQHNFWRYLIFIGNWWPDSTPPIGELGVMWTICLEEQFYLLIPFVASFIFKSKYKAIGVGICIVIGNIWRIVFIENPTFVDQPLYYLTPTYLDSFTYGGLAAWMYQNNISVPIINNTFAVLLLLFIVLYLCSAGGPEIWWGPYNYSTVLSYGLVPLSVSILILHLVKKPESIIGYFLSGNILKILGVLSFGIYLWHSVTQRVINTMISHLNYNTFEVNSLLYFLILLEYCLLPILLSAITFTFVEKPFLNLRNIIYTDRIITKKNRWSLPIKNIIISLSILIAFIVMLTV